MHRSVIVTRSYEKRYGNEFSKILVTITEKELRLGPMDSGRPGREGDCEGIRQKLARSRSEGGGQRRSAILFGEIFMANDTGEKMSTRGRLTICQISDIHCGSAYFVPDLLERSILEINDLGPTAVVVSGDLTDAGYRQEFEAAAEYLRRIQCERVMVIPGNHDSRNVGYIHFERLFGERYSIQDFEEAVMVAVDSSEPDLDEGRVGREHYEFIHETFAMAE